MKASCPRCGQRVSYAPPAAPCAAPCPACGQSVVMLPAALKSPAKYSPLQYLLAILGFLVLMRLLGAL